MKKANSNAGKKRTTIYLPPELIWKLKEVAAKRRIGSDTLAIEAAVEAWVKGEPDAAELEASGTGGKPSRKPPSK